MEFINAELIQKAQEYWKALFGDTTSPLGEVGGFIGNDENKIKVISSAEAPEGELDKAEPLMILKEGCFFDKFNNPGIEVLKKILGGELSNDLMYQLLMVRYNLRGRYNITEDGIKIPTYDGRLRSLTNKELGAAIGAYEKIMNNRDLQQESKLYVGEYDEKAGMVEMMKFMAKGGTSVGGVSKNKTFFIK